VYNLKISRIVMFDKNKKEYTKEDAVLFNNTILNLKKAFDKDLPTQYKILLDELALAGWFIDYDVAPKTLAALLAIDYKNKLQLDLFLVKYYKQKLGAIKKNIITNHPERKIIIKSAFKAHSRKEFELSIPVFLSQIDGICYDLIQKDIFSRGRGKSKDNLPKNWIEKLKIDNLRLSFLEPLRNNTYLSVPIIESKNYPHILSRNLILHGRDLNYATEKNSCKAISLLNYVAVIVSDIKRSN
jgi:hypothetical protein